MKRKWWTVCFLSILAGSALHFLYDLWPNPLTAVFAPVNESVWEHLKLLYWPFLAAAFVLTKDEADGRKSWCGLLAGLLGAPLLLLGAYYTLLSGLFCTRWQWPAALGWRGICRKRLLPRGCAAYW